MSRIGKTDLTVPAGVEIKIEPATARVGNVVTVKGPKGELTREFRDIINIAVEGSTVKLSPKKESIFSNALWGTYSSHINNMLVGVSEGFEKKLIVEGTGYRAELAGKVLKLSLGYSHIVPMDIPEGISVTVEKNDLTITGIDKELVGQFAAEVRSKRKPEPYKGKGIRYSDEVIERKQGKKNVA